MHEKLEVLKYCPLSSGPLGSECHGHYFSIGVLPLFNVFINNMNDRKELLPSLRIDAKPGEGVEGQGFDKGQRDLKKLEELAGGKLVHFSRHEHLW